MLGIDSGRFAAHPEVEKDELGGATIILPGKSEAGSAETQVCGRLRPANTATQVGLELSTSKTSDISLQPY
jgi:hypothetical protein